VLIVVDTFEEAQFLGLSAVLGVAELCRDLQRYVERLRVVMAGARCHATSPRSPCPSRRSSPRWRVHFCASRWEVLANRLKCFRRDTR